MSKEKAMLGINNVASWETDIDNIDDNGFSNYLEHHKVRPIYENADITSFLQNTGQFYIVATKGMGKTLLLRYKRYLLDNLASHNSDIPKPYFIPKNNNSVCPLSINSDMLSTKDEYVSNWENCKAVWELAIKLAIIKITKTDITPYIKDLPQKAEKRWKKKVIQWMTQTTSKPVVYLFDQLVALNKLELPSLIRDISSCVNRAFDNVNTEQKIVMFLDKLDNALKRVSDKIWAPIQIGLFEAALSIRRDNNNIEIYLSIREEAYDAYRSPDKLAAENATLQITYTKDELKKLFEHLVMAFEHTTVAEFIGFEKFSDKDTREGKMYLTLCIDIP